jgi:ATP-dependent Clp protease ATP-binding subunit ClpC
VFERFTDRARRVLVLAQEEARLLNHGFIGTEHILLGLIHEGEGLAAEALAALGISLEAVRAEVEETIGVSGSAPMDPVPFTPRAKKVLELSLREALQMGHQYIGTEHILLGLVREGEGVAATVLVGLGAELPRVRQVVITLISGGQAPYGPVQGPGNATDRSAAATEPRCPRCRSSVTDGTRFRTIDVRPDVDDSGPMSIDVVYCVNCGATLHMFRTKGPS